VKIDSKTGLIAYLGQQENVVTGYYKKGTSPKTRVLKKPTIDEEPPPLIEEIENDTTMVLTEVATTMESVEAKPSIFSALTSISRGLSP